MLKEVAELRVDLRFMNEFLFLLIIKICYKSSFSKKIKSWLA